MSYSRKLFLTASRESFLSVYDFLNWYIGHENFGCKNNDYVPYPSELSLYGHYQDYCEAQNLNGLGVGEDRRTFSNELRMLGRCCGENFFPKQNGVKMIAVWKLKTFYGSDFHNQPSLPSNLVKIEK